MKLSTVQIVDLSNTSPAFRAVLEKADVDVYGRHGVDSLMLSILEIETCETTRALAALGVTTETFIKALKAVRGPAMPTARAGLKQRRTAPESPDAE